MKKALITGITGQDGSYLAEFLLSKGYEVHGVVRRHSTICTERIDHLYDDASLRDRFFIHFGDLTDSCNLTALIRKIEPDEVYNLGAQSHVAVSFEVPEYTAETTGVGTIRLLDAIHQSGVKAKFYQASTSELFGGIPGTAPQSEATPFYPKSPYGAAKLYSYWITKNYREAYGMFACNGILFNHESERRGKEFVTRKITDGVAKIKFNKQDYIELGNLDARRDWGYSKEYVRAIWLILQQEKPDDFVIATGEAHTVREFVEHAFKYAGIDIVWQGTGVDEVAINTANNKVVVKINPQYFRPLDVNYLVGDSTKAFNTFGWKSEVSFEELVKLMVENDLKENN